jgi:hypothetical protein
VNRQATVIALGASLGGCIAVITGRVIGTLRRAGLAAQAEVLEIADGRTLDDMRQRRALARGHAKDVAAHENAIEYGRPLVALVKSTTWNTLIWWTEDQGMATFDRAQFDKDWRLPRGLVTMGFKPGGWERRGRR